MYKQPIGGGFQFKPVMPTNVLRLHSNGNEGTVPKPAMVMSSIAVARINVAAKPITLEDVYAGLDLIAAEPASRELVKRLTVNIRLETGNGINGYKGKELTDSENSAAAANEIMRRISMILQKAEVFSLENYSLIRQLVSSLHVISEVDTVAKIRELAAYLDERAPSEDAEDELYTCPLMHDMRNDIHSRMNPQKNLILVQAVIDEISSGLEDYHRSGSLDRFGPSIRSVISDNPTFGQRLDETLEKLNELKSLLKGLDLHETQLGDIEKWTREIRGHQKFLTSGSAGDVNRCIEEFLSLLEGKDYWKACMQLGVVRSSLNKLMIESMDSERLCSLLIDLSLEKIGFVLYGQIIHGQFTTIDRGNLPNALKILKSLILSVRAKGQGDERLELLANKIDTISDELGLFFLIDRINRQCIKISDDIDAEYKDLAKEACRERGIMNKNAADLFITQMIRGTTLQHMSDLISKIHACLLRNLKEDCGHEFTDNLTTVAGQLFSFTSGEAEGGLKEAALLGNKGAYLSEMAKWGIPVPPGFVISTMMGKEYLRTRNISAELKEGITYKVRELEEITGLRFGDPSRPLVVSVRSGAVMSMPGMMDTILNVGLNDETVEGLSKRGGELFALDSYRRFIELYSHQILGLDKGVLESIYTASTEENGGKKSLTPAELRKLIEIYKETVLQITGKPFPQDVTEQLYKAIETVFLSWNSERAITFRNHCHIQDALGTAATVQAMVFGNLDEVSGTGKVVTRHFRTGKKILNGEFQYRAQGDDVMSGSVTPYTVGRLERQNPEIYAKLEEICRKIEKNARDIMEIEFTIQGGKVYILQTRKAQLIAPSIENVAIAQMRLEGIEVDRRAKSPTNHNKFTIFDPNAKQEVLTSGFPGSSGVGTGVVALDTETALKWAAQGKSVIMVRAETSPTDYPGLEASKGILTSIGGITSHAADCARRMGIPCVTGCESLKIDMETRTFMLNGYSFKEGDEISIDGMSGNVLKPIPVVGVV